MSDKESILRKIKHCLALSKSSNETEAATALRQAYTMMQKYGISMADIELANIKESTADTYASKQPVLYQSYLARVIATMFGCKFYIEGKIDGWYYDKIKYQYSWVFVGVEMYAEIASYAFDVLNRQLKSARRAYMANELKRVRLAKNKYARADEFCLGWVDSVRQLIQNLVPPNIDMALIEQFLSKKELTTSKALDRVSHSKAKSATNDYHNGRQQGKNAQLHNSMHSSIYSTGLLDG